LPADLIWIHYARARTSWYELAEPARDRLQSKWAAVRSASENAGAHSIGCFSVRGQADFSTAEVWLFPSVDDVVDHWNRLTTAGYLEWFATANSVGVRKVH